MGKTDFELIEVPDRYLPIVGQPRKGTRLFERFAPKSEFQEWWHTVLEICGEQSCLSPGGVSMYADVSRAGVHKRMQEGRITAFLFHVLKEEKADHYSQPYIYIPGAEIHRWAALIEAMPSRRDRKAEAVGDGDFDGRFVRPPKPPKKGWFR